MGPEGVDCGVLGADLPDLSILGVFAPFDVIREYVFRAGATVSDDWNSSSSSSIRKPLFRFTGVRLPFAEAPVLSPY